MIFSLAKSGSIAFSRVMGPGAIENIPLNPALSNSGRFSILPASTITGICSFCASFSILYGTFPIMLLAAVQRGGEQGQNLHHVSHDAVVAVLKDRRVAVFVDGHDGGGVLKKSDMVMASNCSPTQVS